MHTLLMTLIFSLIVKPYSTTNKCTPVSDFVDRMTASAPSPPNRPIVVARYYSLENKRLLTSKSYHLHANLTHFNLVSQTNLLSGVRYLFARLNGSSCHSGASCSIGNKLAGSCISGAFDLNNSETDCRTL